MTSAVSFNLVRRPIEKRDTPLEVLRNAKNAAKEATKAKLLDHLTKTDRLRMLEKQYEIDVMSGLVSIKEEDEDDTEEEDTEDETEQEMDSFEEVFDEENPEHRYNAGRTSKLKEQPEI